jgi:hypothetical protein
MHVVCAAGGIHRQLQLDLTASANKPAALNKFSHLPLLEALYHIHTMFNLR